MLLTTAAAQACGAVPRSRLTFTCSSGKHTVINKKEDVSDTLTKVLHAGGAIFVDSGSQSNITGSVFTLNSAGQSGGAVSQADSTSVIVTSQFISNSGSTQGGAVFQNNMTGSVTNCRFFNNTGMTGVGTPSSLGTRRRYTLVPFLPQTASMDSGVFSSHSGWGMHCILTSTMTVPCDITLA